MEFPVLYFDVEITDITGVPSELSGRYNASSGDPLVLQINSSVCLPVMISVNATNDIGMNSSYATLPHNYGINTSAYAFNNNIYTFIKFLGTETALLREVSDDLLCGRVY
jgi:hypothetical protein